MGAYAVQLAAQAGLHVFATAPVADTQYVRTLGAATVIDYKSSRFEELVPTIDIVLDTVGAETRERSFGIVKPGGILVSVVSKPTAAPGNIRTVFFLVEVTTERLNRLTDLFQRNKLVPRVGSVLPLEHARTAHEMLAGAPHKPGKIVLQVADLGTDR